MITKTKILVGFLGLIIIVIISYITILFWPFSPKESFPNARAQSIMIQLQAKADLIYDTDKSYNNLSCTYDDMMKKICDAVRNVVGMEPIIHKTEDKYCAYIKLVKELEKEWFCIDSKGLKERITINPSSSGYCDGITFTCLKEEKELIDETADWQTYRNKEFSFEMKYPEESFLSGNRLFLNSGSYTPETTLTRKYVDILGEKKSKEECFRGGEEVEINDIEFRKEASSIYQEGYYLNSLKYFSFYKDNCIILNFNLESIPPEGEYAGRDYGREKESEVFNQMLSTFRFIEREISATPSINISSPDGGEILKIGENYLITWSCLDVPTTKSYYIARLFLSMDGKMPHGTIDGTPQAYNQIVGCPTDGGKFLWEVGRVERGTILPGDNYQVKIELIEVGDGKEQIIISDVSDNYFSIVE